MNTVQKSPVAPEDFAGVLSGTALMLVDAVAGAIAGGAALSGDLTRLFARWQDRLDQRRRLANLDDRLLSDIGVDRLRALNEAEKPFWRS
ncbi:DUF1127 domain-containing protein [Marivibrio halodurans]|nr:DUF1127 domain-containing protein [Marivibrio halodurans]